MCGWSDFSREILIPLPTTFLTAIGSKFGHNDPAGSAGLTIRALRAIDVRATTTKPYFYESAVDRHIGFDRWIENGIDRRSIIQVAAGELGCGVDL